MKIIIQIGEKTTYDFGSKTFGHATTFVGPFKSVLDPAFIELKKARERLKEEYAKMDRGESYDKRFVCGSDLFEIYKG
jgi:hypothetical protein